MHCVPQRPSSSRYLLGAALFIALVAFPPLAFCPNISPTPNGVRFTTDGEGEYFVKRDSPLLDYAFPFERRVAFVKYAADLRKKIASSQRKNMVLFDVKALEGVIEANNQNDEKSVAYDLQYVIANALWNDADHNWKTLWDFFVEINSQKLLVGPLDITHIAAYPGIGYPGKYQYMFPVTGTETNLFMSQIIFDFPNALAQAFKQSREVQAALRHVAIDTSGQPDAQIRIENNLIVLTIDSVDQMAVPLEAVSQLLGMISLDPMWDTFDAYKKSAFDPKDLWKGERKRPFTYAEDLSRFNYEYDFFQAHVSAFRTEMDENILDNPFTSAAESPETWRLVGSLAEFLYAHPDTNYLFTVPLDRDLEHPSKFELSHDDAIWPKSVLDYWLKSIVAIRDIQLGIPTLDSLLLKNINPDEAKIKIPLLPIALESFGDNYPLLFKNANVKITWQPKTHELEILRIELGGGERKTVRIKAASLIRRGMIFRDSDWLRRNKFLYPDGKAAWKIENKEDKGVRPKRIPKKGESGEGGSSCGEKL